MKFTVLWLGSAEQELADLWLASEDRDSLASAANEVDRLLRACPMEVGESREQGRRILIVRPIAVKYRVSTEDRLVRVLHVWKPARSWE